MKFQHMKLHINKTIQQMLYTQNECIMILNIFSINFVQYIHGQYTNTLKRVIVNYIMKTMKDEMQISGVNINSIAHSYRKKNIEISNI